MKSNTYDIDCMKIKEVTAALTISRNTLANMTKDGELTAYRIGGRVVYKKSEVFQYLENNKVKAA